MKPFQIAKATIYVHYTRDERGKMLSLSYGNIQLTVPFKEIEDMIEECADENEENKVEARIYYENETVLAFPCIRIIKIPDDNYSCGYRNQYEVCFFNRVVPYLCSMCFNHEQWQEAIDFYKERIKFAEETNNEQT